MPLSDQNIKTLEKKGYRFVGSHNHSAAKVCHWTKKSIMDDGVCYKEKFYGIKSHRCLQMSPSIPFCHHKCLFCWRDVDVTSTSWTEDYDDPGQIIDECIEAQRKLLVGFFGNPNANQEKVLEAQDPTNAAISLAGEPLLYPSINQLLEEYARRNFTTFLVSNGLSPEKLGNLDPEPTQLYLSLDAPNREVYQKICDPQIPDGWERLNHSLELLSSFNCRTVIRMTCVAGHNMTHPEEYARIIESTNPDFVEIKAYMYVGSSRERLKFENIPRSRDILSFAQNIASLCGREIVDQSLESRVVLLA